MRKILFCLLLGFALAACGSDGSPPDPSGGGGKGGMGGAGGAGGSDGTGGTDGSGGGGGTIGGIPPDGSGWEGIEPHLEWRVQGFGQVFELLVADFTGDGENEIAIGARRPLLLEGDGSSIRWYVDWEPGETLYKGGDGEFVYGLAAIPSDVGGADLLVTSSLPDAFLIDGRTGERIWHQKLEQEFPFVKLTVFGDPEDPLFFTAYGRKAYRAKTGEEAWEIEAGRPNWVRTIRWDEQEPSGLLIGQEMEATLDGNYIGFPTIHVIDTDGQIVLEMTFPNDKQLTEVFTADLDGNGVESPILHFEANELRALFPDGSTRWETTVSIFANPVDHMLASHAVADIDGDGKEEILLVYTNGWYRTEERTSTLVLLGADGQIRWTYDLAYLAGRPSFARVGEETLILAPAGNPYVISRGALVVLDPTKTPENGGVLLRHETFYPVSHATVIERDGGVKIAYAGIDGNVRTIDWPNREDGWEVHWMRWAWKSIAFETEDQHFVAVGEDFGKLSLYDASGTRRWHRALADGRAWEITALAHGHLGGEMRIVTSSIVILGEEISLLETYSMQGQRRYAFNLDKVVLALHVDDLDGDGSSEILYVSVDDENICRLHVSNEAGMPLHAVELGICAEAEIVTGDADGDGKREIAVRTNPELLPGPPLLYFFEHDGTIRWFFEESIDVTIWLEFVEKGLVAGGGSTNGEGFVALRDFDSGEKIWRTGLAKDDSFFSNFSTHGVVFSAGGDYVATHTPQGLVYLLDQADGLIYWKATTNYTDEIHGAAPLAFVPATETTPAFLAVSQGGVGYTRSYFHAFSLSGDIQWKHLMYSPARFTHGIRLPDGRPAATVVTTLGVYTFAFEGEEVQP